LSNKVVYLFLYTPLYPEFYLDFNPYLERKNLRNMLGLKRLGFWKSISVLLSCSNFISPHVSNMLNFKFDEWEGKREKKK
jgi:hypothetical protein